MTVQFSAGRFTLRTATARIYLTQTELVILLKFFGAVPHYDSPQILESEANTILNHNIEWFEAWDDLTAFQHYTREDWENLLDACEPTRLVVISGRFLCIQPLLSDN